MNWTHRTASISVIALLVASTALGPVAFAGTVLSQQQPQPDVATAARLDSGATFWQGQQLWLWGGNANAGETWQLREWDEQGAGNVGSLVTEFTLNENGVATLPSAGLRGQYVVVTQDGTPVFFRNGTIPDNATANDPSFEIVAQELNASFVDGTVTTGSGDGALTDLELRSNRGEYRVALQSDQLTDQQLTEIFSANRTDVDGDGQTEVVLTRPVTGPRDALDANFSTVDPGEYEIVADVIDAGATATATIEVREPGQQSANLNQSVLVEQRGDVANFSVNLNGTQNATITIGSQEVNYQASVRVRDVNDDGEVRLRFNTFVAGRNVAPTGGFTAVGPDEIIDYNLDTEPLTTPLDAGQYTVTANLGGQPVDIATLILEEQSLQSMTVWTAPDSAEPGSATELFDAVSRDDTIAREDWTVIEVSGSGLYGYLQEPANLNDPSLGLQLNITRTNVGPNVQPEPVPLDRVRLVPDPQNNHFFLLLDTNGLESGAQYRATFTMTEENPYVQQNRSVSANFSIVERRVTVANASGDQPLRLSLGQAVVSGNSTLAPGSQFDVRLRSTGGNPFVQATEVTVNQNGTWTANFDVPDVPNGTEVQVLVPNYNVSSQAVLVEGAPAAGQPAGQANQTTTAQTQETTTTTTTTTETTTTETETTTAVETTPAEDTTTTETTEEGGGGGGGIPGFGIGVALVALVAAAYLAIRRSR